MKEIDPISLRVVSTQSDQQSPLQVVIRLKRGGTTVNVTQRKAARVSRDAESERNVVHTKTHFHISSEQSSVGHDDIITCLPISCLLMTPEFLRRRQDVLSVRNVKF